MVHQRKKRPQEQNSPQSLPQVQTSLFASPGHESTNAEEVVSDSNLSSLTLGDQHQLATQSKSGFDFGQIPLYATDASTPMPIQAKLTVGAANDKYEQEADHVAAEVVDTISRPTPPTNHQGVDTQRLDTQRLDTPNLDPQRTEDNDALQPSSISDLQRQGDGDELQTQSSAPGGGLGGGAISPNVERQIQSAKGSGQSLDPNLQQQMGQAMGANFSGVKIHTDSQSDQLNQSIQAKAFTTGQDVFFRQNAYNPHSKGGQELIAHELTHVMQQNHGVVRAKHDASHSANVQVTPQSQPTLQRKKYLTKGSDNYSWQSIAKLYALSNHKLQVIKELIAHISDETGGTAAPLDESGVEMDESKMVKGMERAIWKGVIKKTGLVANHFEGLTDIVRGSIVYDDCQQLLAGLKGLSDRLSRHGSIIVDVKNRFQNPASGYRDFLINVSFSGSFNMVAELQFHVKSMSDAKKQGHGIYEDLRLRKEATKFLIKERLKMHQVKNRSAERWNTNPKTNQYSSQPLSLDPNKFAGIQEAIDQQETKVGDLEAQSAQLYDQAYEDQIGASDAESAAAEELSNLEIPTRAKSKLQTIDQTYSQLAASSNLNYQTYKQEAKTLLAKVLTETHQIEDAVDTGDAATIDQTLGGLVDQHKAEKAAKKAAKKEKELDQMIQNPGGLHGVGSHGAWD